MLFYFCFCSSLDYGRARSGSLPKSVARPPSTTSVVVVVVDDDNDRCESSGRDPVADTLAEHCVIVSDEGSNAIVREDRELTQQLHRDENSAFPSSALEDEDSAVPSSAPEYFSSIVDMTHVSIPRSRFQGRGLFSIAYNRMMHPNRNRPPCKKARRSADVAPCTSTNTDTGT